MELYSHNPHLTEHEVAQSFFRLGGGAFSFGQGGGKESESPHLVQDGRLGLEFVPVRQGVHALEVSAVPRSEVSSFLRLEDLEVVGNVPDSPVPGRHGGKGVFVLPGEEALRLDDWLARRHRQRVGGQGAVTPLPSTLRDYEGGSLLLLGFRPAPDLYDLHCGRTGKTTDTLLGGLLRLGLRGEGARGPHHSSLSVDK